MVLLFNNLYIILYSLFSVCSNVIVVLAVLNGVLRGLRGGRGILNAHEKAHISGLRLVK